MSEFVSVIFCRRCGSRYVEIREWKNSSAVVYCRTCKNSSELTPWLLSNPPPSLHVASPWCRWPPATKPACAAPPQTVRCGTSGELRSPRRSRHRCAVPPSCHGLHASAPFPRDRPRHPPALCEIRFRPPCPHTPRGRG